MTKQKIRAGDRVEVLDESFGVLESGSKGTVVSFGIRNLFGKKLIGVELDKEFSKGHDCDGLAKDGCGGYFVPKELKVIEGETENDNTPRNMGQIFEEIDRKQHAIELCKQYGINLDLLGEFFRLRAKGLKTVEIGRKLKVHRVTVSRYIKAMRTMKESEFAFLFDFVMGECSDETNV